MSLLNYTPGNTQDIYYIFEKMFSPQGKLIAVECLTRVAKNNISPEHFFQHASDITREMIFMEQLAVVEAHQYWFKKHNVRATINVDDHTLKLFNNQHFLRRIEELSYVHFEINEHSTSLINDFLVNRLKKNSPTFWLDDYGSGYAGLDVIRRYHFDYIKISKETLWYLMANDFGQHFMHSLVSFLDKNGHKVVIEGIETQKQLDWIQGMDWYAAQGYYWPAVTIDTLTDENE